MTEMLCTACGAVDAMAGSCPRCGSPALLASDAPAARRYLEARAASTAAGADAGRSALRAEATGKVLGRALGRLFGGK